MLTSEKILETVLRPTSDNSTNSRTYKHFYDPVRHRTENYDSDRFRAIHNLGVYFVDEITYGLDLVYSSEKIICPEIFSKNIDSLAWVRKNKLTEFVVLKSEIVKNFYNV